MSKQLTKTTRRSILDYLSISQVAWAGRLPEDVFLSRLYDLSDMPSTDYRFGTAASDILQHRVMFQDWDDDWVFYDDRFDLLDAPAQEFLRFICETVHPVVRPNVEEVDRLVTAYNSALGSDGWELIPTAGPNDKPIYISHRIGQAPRAVEAPTGWNKVDRQVQEVKLRLMEAQTEEQFQSVGLLCREILISVAEEVYDPIRHRPLKDEVVPSKSDAGRLLEGFFNVELARGTNDEARAHAKASLRLALALQHKRTADFRTAAICAEAAFSVVNIVAIVCGRRA